MFLRHLPDLVSTSLYLYDLCIIHRYAFDMEWTEEAKEMMENKANNTFGNLKTIDVFHVTENAIKEMQKYNILISIQN